MSSEYRELLHDLADEITLKELARMKFLSADILPDVKPDDNHGEVLFEVFNFFLELEKQNILSVNNLEKLKYLLKKAKRNDLVSKVEDFESRSRNSEKASDITLPLSPAASTSSIPPGAENCSVVMMPSSTNDEDKAKEKKRRKRERYKQKRKAEKCSGLNTEEAHLIVGAHRGAFTTIESYKEKCLSIGNQEFNFESPKTSKEQETQMIRNNNNIVTAPSLTASFITIDNGQSVPLAKEVKSLSKEKKDAEIVKEGLQEKNKGEMVKGLSKEKKDLTVIEGLPREKVKGLSKEKKDEIVKEGLQEKNKGEMVKEGLSKEKKDGVVKGLSKEKKDEMVKECLSKENKDEMVKEGLQWKKKDEMVKEGLQWKKKDEMVKEGLSKEKKDGMVKEGFQWKKKDGMVKGLSKEKKDGMVKGLSKEKKDEMVKEGLQWKKKDEMVKEGLQWKKKDEMVKEGLQWKKKDEMVKEGLPKKKKEEMVKVGLSKEKKDEMVKEGLSKEKKEEMVKEDLQWKKKDEMVKESLSKEKKDGIVKGLPKEKKDEMVKEGLSKEKKNGMVQEDLLKEKKDEMVKEGISKEKKDEKVKEKFLPPQKDWTKIQEYLTLKKDGKVEEILPTAKRKEIKDKGPELSGCSTPTLNKNPLDNTISFQQPSRHILSLCTKWQSWGESIPVLNRELCLALARAGHRVACMVLESSDLDKTEARKGNVQLIQCCDRPGIKSDDPQLLYHDQKLPYKPDLVIGHGKLTGPAAVFYANKMPCPRLHIIHDLPNECFMYDEIVEKQFNEQELAKTADFIAAVGTLLKEQWAALINREVFEIVPGLPDLTTRNSISSPQCRYFVPARFCSPVASGLKTAVVAVNNSSKREIRNRRSTLIVCNTDSSGSFKPAKKTLKECDKKTVDLNERAVINIQQAYFDIQGATVFLSPARAEAFGVAALDAIAIGIPVVISNKTGLAYAIRQHFDEKFHSCIKDISHGPEADVNGEDDDGQIWSIELDRISLYPDKAFAFADELRAEWKKKFSWDATVQQLMTTLTKSGKLLSASTTQPFNANITNGVPDAYSDIMKELNLFDKRQKVVLFLSPEDPRLLNYNAVHLGLVRWAAVFDFDCDSTTKGYLKCCEGLLENSGKPACRMLPPPKEDLGKQNQNLTLPNGIPWILLQGVPEMERDIMDGNLDWIQEIFNHLKKRHSCQFTLLIIWKSTRNSRHLCKKLYQIQLQVQASPFWKNAVKLVLLSTSDEVDSRLDDIAEEWGVEIKKVDINQLCDAIHSTAIANPLYKLDPEFSLPKRNASDIQDVIALTTLPSSMRWVDSALEVLYASIGDTPEFGKDDAHHFYRGGKISWYGLQMNYAVERESWEPLSKQIEEELKYPGAAFLTLFHQRGTGGTTSARKLLYDFHLRYPCVCLKTTNYETFLAIKVIWEFCSLPVIILADINEAIGADDNDIEALFGNLSNEKVSCLLLHIVHRHYQVDVKKYKKPGEKETVNLAKPLTENERQKFVKVYSLYSPSKKSELRGMKNADEQLQTPFYYGLVAFEDQFKGLEPFVKDCLQGLNDKQRKMLCFLSMAHQYAQIELPLSTFAGIFNLKPRQLHSIEDILSPESIGLIIEDYGCWRPRHCTLGKEMLRQLLTVPYSIHPENWQRNLANKAIEFVSYIVEEETTKAVLLNRISDEKTYKRFSSLVEDIPESEDVVKVFEMAISVHPKSPFLKAHFGRYYSVRRGLEGFEIALQYTNESILIASDMTKNVRSQLIQMKGMIYKRQVKSQIERIAILDDIVSLAMEGVKAFTRAASISPDRLESCYIPQVRMMCDVFRYIDLTFEGGLFKYLQSPAAHQFILDGISETSDVLESVSESIYYPDLRKDLSKLGRNGGSRSEETNAYLIKHFQELKKTSRTSIASINRHIVLLQLELCKERKKPVSEIAKESIQLLEEALKYDKKIDLTMRLWVRVAPHIPVELQAAESKIAAWCNKGKSVMSYLYRFIFSCIRILEGGRDQRFEDERRIALNDLHKAVHATKRLSLVHPDRPVVFIGSAKGMGQLVTVEESVREVRKQRTIPDGYAGRLRRLTGIITKTGKDGKIKADGLSISFRADLCQPPLVGESYLAKKVCFYLAFTYFEADAYNVRIVGE